jgi:cytochrome P450
MSSVPFASESKNSSRKPHSDRGASADASLRTIRIEDFNTAREVLRSGDVRQAGFKAELLERFAGGAHAPVLFQEGEAHQRQRSATARFFAPRAVATRYRDLMERMSDGLIERLRSAGRARLDDLSLELAVAVAAEIIGLTDSSKTAMAIRLNRFFAARADAGGVLSGLAGFVAGQSRMLMFYLFDVRPAIRARRRDQKDDVISHLIGQGYSNREILTECVTYSAAGMATTREFIVMAALRLLEQADLRVRFLNSDESGQIQILEEILRLEPVVGVLKRRAKCDFAIQAATGAITIAAKTLVEIDVRAANRDTAAAGACPHLLDPDRQLGAKMSASLMGFGDGPHRCPGASVALQEAAIFLDRLLRLPNLRLEQAPSVTTNPLIASYELRNAIVTVG